MFWLKKRFIIISGLIIVAVAVMGAVIYFFWFRFKQEIAVNSFDDCVKAGYPVTLSYPSSCRTFDGRLFIQKHPAEPVFCTMEVKLCPDGSYVARTGPKCEFAPCPASKGKSTSTLELPGFLKGNITIGPICPVERVDNPCKPTPEMYAARKIFVYNQTKTLLVKEITPGPDGGYKTDLPPGAYIIDVAHSGIGFARGVPAHIKIESGKTITLDIDIDTGIR